MSDDIREMTLRVELSNLEGLLLEEIADNRIKRKSVAKTYCLALQSSEIDWQKVNEAIISRWSVSALEYIKRLAWSGKAFE